MLFQIFLAKLFCKSFFRFKIVPLGLGRLMVLFPRVLGVCMVKKTNVTCNFISFMFQFFFDAETVISKVDEEVEHNYRPETLKEKAHEAMTGSELVQVINNIKRYSCFE